MTAATVTAAARVAVSRAAVAAAKRSLAQAVAVPTVINQDGDCYSVRPHASLLTAVSLTVELTSPCFLLTVTAAE